MWRQALTVQAGHGLFLHGAQWFTRGLEFVPASVEVGGGRVVRILEPANFGKSGANAGSIDLSGFHVLPNSSTHTIICNMHCSLGSDHHRTGTTWTGAMTFINRTGR